MKNTSANAIITENYSIRNCARNQTLARRIFAEFLDFRRTPAPLEKGHDLNCQKCASPHLPKIYKAVRANKPVLLILPAFPGKSPNLEKVLSPLPDYAEQLALNFLSDLCQRIKKYYPPGVQIILCSDGRVFSDVVGMKEADVSAYQVELMHLIEQMSLSDISLVNLDDLYKTRNFDQMRHELLKHYGNSIELTKQQIRSGAQASASQEDQESNRLYRGITRFLFEDALHKQQTKSRSALQNEARSKAYELIRRSTAWSNLIAQRFPDAVRLSIHPQTCGAKKLGLRLINHEIWMTPWHGVAVETQQGFVLLKRREAEALGAQLIYSARGRPSHYQLKPNAQLANGIQNDGI